ncbi:MAG: response regulator transcription factor [Bacteroidales bacterium]|nr:MAG: response regulator transcription factor [Bacteroidales bacterium]
MKIIIVDDNEEFRSTLKFFIEQKLKNTVIAEANSGEEFLTMDLRVVKDADVILMDIIMKNISGIEATMAMNWNHYGLKIIAVTMHVEKVFLTQIIEAGFKGCVFKSDIFKELETALNEVNAGRLYLNPDIKIKPN